MKQNKNSSPIFQTHRNLRKSVLQGQPWIYKEALTQSEKLKDGELVKLLDSKGKFLCWTISNSNHPIALRVISLEKQKPSFEFLIERVKSSIKLRTAFFEGQTMKSKTEAYRLLNGEGDQLPGIIVDRYGPCLVLQFDGPAFKKFWLKEPLLDTLSQLEGVESLFYKSRSSKEGRKANQFLDVLEFKSKEISFPICILENGVKFLVDSDRGQKTGFFLDQRDNRNFVKQLSASKSVLNLFSYTGGFSVYAGVGGASKVVSVDISKDASQMAEQNWALNDLDPAKHQALGQDVFEYIEKTPKNSFDVVICDPPSMAKSEKQKAGAINKYTQLFAQAAKLCKKNGTLILSSCSSHISFSDFDLIVQQSLSQARLKAQVLRISGQGLDHPFPHAFPEFRYLKFYALKLNS